MIVPHGSSEVKTPKAGDWRCQGCNDLQFAKNPTCRKCGERKPQSADLQEALAAQTETALAVITPAQSPVIAQLCQGEEWQCPLCKEISFANRVSCRRCGCPRPEGPMVIETVQHQLAQGGYIGYLPDPSKIEATSSWSKQWNAGPLPGAMTLNSMQTEALPYDPDAPMSSSTSSSDTSGSSESDSDDSSGEKKKKLKRKAEAKKQQSEAQKDESSGSDSSGSSNEQARKKKQKTDEDKKARSKEDKTKENAKPSKDDKTKATDGAAKTGKENGKPKDPEKEAKKIAKAKEKAKREKKFKKTMDVDEELEKRRLQRERRKSRVVPVL